MCVCVCVCVSVCGRATEWLGDPRGLALLKELRYEVLVPWKTSTLCIVPAAVGSCFSSLYDGLFTCQQDPLYGLPLKTINNKQVNMFYKRFQRVNNGLSHAPRVGLQDGSILLLLRFIEQVACTCVVLFWM